MDGVDGRNLVHKILEEKQKSCKFSKIHLHSDTINNSSCRYSRQTRVPSEKVSIERTFQSSSVIKGISIALGGRGILWREMIAHTDDNIEIIISLERN